MRSRSQKKKVGIWIVYTSDKSNSVYIWVVHRPLDRINKSIHYSNPHCDRDRDWERIRFACNKQTLTATAISNERKWMACNKQTLTATATAVTVTATATNGNGSPATNKNQKKSWRPWPRLQQTEMDRLQQTKFEKKKLATATATAVVRSPAVTAGSQSR